jgi:tetratricopeptide (TPR) repeat protein
MLDWFNAREAADTGAALADKFASQLASHAKRDGKTPSVGFNNALVELLRRADSEVRSLRLNFFRKAKFANSFKWRLIESGVAREIADEVTQSLVLHLARPVADPLQNQESRVAPADHTSLTEAKRLFSRANQCFARGAYADAADLYRSVLEIDSHNAGALSNLGTALSRLGLLAEAEQHLRRAVMLQPDHVEAHCNLGVVLRGRGELHESELWLQRAVKLNPNFAEARVNHGITLLGLGRVREAKSRFAKVLKTAPRNAEALFLTGHVARIDGRFDEAETRYRQALEINPRMPDALAAIPGVRKMTTADAEWLKAAKEIAERAPTPAEETDLRFAIGKYCDDVEDFEQAFSSFKRANQLLKASANPYQPDAHTFFVEDMIRIYTPEAIVSVREGVSASNKPVFVVGMPRSGTSLVEQIIASHPSAKGAGELGFCDDSMRAHDSALRQGLLSEAARKKRAEVYLRALEAEAGDALRIIDKAPINSDYLGPIYSVFPNARIIHMRRDPIDTCLSCYFQQFSTAMNFAMDLSDLAHYFRQHQRLMTHWRAVLPKESILDLPYADLVADQESWTRKILDFLGLEWDEQCLDYYKTERQVLTASAWQVRQKIYKTSVARWRNYERFIGPLLELRD